MLTTVRAHIKNAGDPEKAKIFQRFFKTGKGQYGEGDQFIGITVPQSRTIALQYRNLPLHDVEKLLASPIHEERLIALLILVLQFSHVAKASRDKQREIYDFYLAHTKYINNWDLVDVSAEKIVGEYLLRVAKAPKMLEKLAKSDNLWEKRIGMIATFAFLKQGKAEETFAIADMLLQDKHDLIQKAVGWMLREAGKRVSEKKLEGFLLLRYKTMPRTMLRYAIERFPEEKRKAYLRGSL